MTGSVVLPVKAVLMNALTVGAALGALVFVYQDGRFTDLLGYTPNGGHRAHRLPGHDRADLRPVHRLRRLPAGPDQGGPRRRCRRAGGGRGRGSSAPVRSSPRRRSCSRWRSGPSRTSSISFIQQIGVATAVRRPRRRLRGPLAAGAVADGAARQVQLVGPDVAAPAARPARTPSAGAPASRRSGRTVLPEGMPGRRSGGYRRRERGSHALILDLGIAAVLAGADAGRDGASRLRHPTRHHPVSRSR